MDIDYKREIALVYMVAGISSRFLGKIKQFAIVSDNGETLIEHSLKQALSAGFSKIVFIVGNKTEKPFKEKFGNNYQGVSIYYALQSYDESERDKPWGTTDALCSARHFLDCGFVVCNGDDLYGKNSFEILVEHLRNEDSCACLGFRLGKVIPDKGKTNRGIFECNKDNFVRGLKEVFEIEKDNLESKGLDEDSLCSMNIFALQPRVLDYLKDLLVKFKEEHVGDRKIEALLPNDVSEMIDEGKIKMKLYSTPDIWLGVTNPGDEDIIKEKLKEENC